MSEEEVYEILDRVKVNYQHLAMPDELFDEWYNQLKYYAKDEVYKNLDNYFKSDRKRRNIPLVYDLIDGLLTIEQQKTKSKDNFKIDCQLCHRFMTLEEYNNHYDKCLLIKTLIPILQKNGETVDYDSLNEYDYQTLDKVYDKYVPIKKEINFTGVMINDKN